MGVGVRVEGAQSGGVRVGRTRGGVRMGEVLGGGLCVGGGTYGEG